MKVLLATFAFSVSLFATAQTDILDARTSFSVGQTVTLTGIVTNGAEMGSTVRYLQDSSAGIALFSEDNWSGFTTPDRGDMIEITGVLSEYNGLLEVGPTINTVSILSSDNALPAPQPFNPNQLGEANEGELAVVSGAVFSNGGGVFGGNNTYNFTSGGQTGAAYVRTGSALVGSVIPAGPIDLTGIVSQFSFSGVGGYQLLPRDAADLLLLSGINIVSKVNQTNISTSGFSLSWTSEPAGDTKVEYGLSPDNLEFELYSPGSVVAHTAMLTGLNAGTIYYARVSSTDGEDIAQSQVIPFVTKSLSTGEIVVYFNGSVRTEFAETEEAISLGAATNDTIAAYIDRSMHTLDMAIYNINDQLVVSAINDAYDRGVVIRYIAQGTNLNSGIQQFNDAIPVHLRMDDNGSGMHNKFIIIDADHTELSTLITGSTNLTTNNLNEDFNNMIIFSDESICKGFRLEFEEMWGGSGPLPDPGNSKFSSQKSLNTPLKYIVGTTPVEAYFSPSDQTSNGIKDAVLSTDISLEFALLAFTYDELASAVITASENFFVFVRGIIEQSSGTGADFDQFVSAGLQVLSHQATPFDLHHKYAIVDAAAPDSDPTVITGSHNWSSSAETVNDENTIIVHDARVANLYFQEFMARFLDLVHVEEVSVQGQIALAPNPASDVCLIINTSGHPLPHLLLVTDKTGREVLKMRPIGATAVLDVSGLSNGLYFIRFVDANNTSGKVIKLMVQ